MMQSVYELSGCDLLINETGVNIIYIQRIVLTIDVVS